VTSLRDVALLRLAAQRLVGEPHATPADAVRWATCTQAQDYPASLSAVALRSAERSVAAVTTALDAGEMVRSWPMRGTLHLLAPEDLRWMLAIGPPRVAATAAKRRRDLGLDDALLARARDVTVGALEGGRRIARQSLMSLWRDAGLDTEEYRGGHLFGALAVEGLICLGPTTGRRQDVVLVDEWVAPAPERDRDEAVQEWALRYFRSHGPATERDLAWWTGLTLTEVRRTVAAVADRLEQVEVDGVVHHMDPATPALLDGFRAEAARRVLLLPAFDELHLGYGDRSAVVPPEHAKRVVDGGMIHATVVAGGTTVGTWRRPRSGDGPPEVSPLTTLTRSVAAAVPRSWAAYPRPA
jgi:hypothetical protein